MDDIDAGGKYDRQVRLWASGGQRRLVDASVALVGGSVVGSEVLKNVVLPGVGRVVVVDRAVVTAHDVNCNYFVGSDEVGQNRARVLCKGLGELNPDVHFEAVEDPIHSLGTDFWAQFACVVSDTRGLVMESLAELLWELNVPLVVVSCVGFYASVRIQLREQFIIETHDNDLSDLRVDMPWPELEAHCKTLGDDAPYSVVLTNLFAHFKDNKGCKPRPADVRRILASQNSESAVEAAKKASVVLKDSASIPQNLKTMFEAIKDQTSVEWAALRGLRDFYTLNGVLPLSGVIPDMQCSTEQYVALKNIYAAKHMQDKAQLASFIANYAKTALDPVFLDAFAKNARFMACIWGTSLKTKIPKHILEENPPGLGIYLALQTLDYFHTQNGRLPSTADSNLDVLCKTKMALLNDFVPVGSSDCQNVLHELARADGNPVHNVCTILGGIAAQEVVKIITAHYIPLDNCLVYDGVHGKAYTLKV